MGLTSGPWTQAAILQLERLWASGMRTAEIGALMGITKSAVVGKAHRLLLPGRQSPIKRDGNGQPRPAPPPRRKHTLAPLPSEAVSQVAQVPTPDTPVFKQRKAGD